MIKILVNDADRTPYVIIESISLNDSITVKSDNLSFELDIEEFSVTPPRCGNYIEFRNYFTSYPSSEIASKIYDTDEVLYDDIECLYYIREFYGTIVTVEYKWVSPPKWIKYTVTACDNTRFFDRKLVNNVYEAGLYAGDIVVDIITNYTTGFTYNHVEKGYKVPEQTFDYSEPSACIQAIAEAIGYQWYIDQQNDVHFFWCEQKPSPLQIYTSNILNADTELVYAYNLTLTEDISQVKNRIIIKNANFKSDAQIYDDFTEANRKVFNSSYKLYPFSIDTTQEERAQYVTVELHSLSGSSYVLDKIYGTILLDGIEGSAGDGTGDNDTVYVNFDNKTIRLPDNHALESNHMIRVYFYRTEDVPVLEISQESIEEMKDREGGSSSGIYEFSFDGSSIFTENGEELTAAVDRVLLRYKDPLISGTFQSRLRGWKAGQSFVLNSNYFGSSRSDPIYELVFVKEVTKTIQKHDIIEYTVTFSSSPFGD